MREGWGEKFKLENINKKSKSKIFIATSERHFSHISRVEGNCL